MKRQVSFQPTVPEHPFLLRATIGKNDSFGREEYGVREEVWLWRTRAQLIALRKQIDQALEEGRLIP